MQLTALATKRYRKALKSSDAGPFSIHRQQRKGGDRMSHCQMPIAATKTIMAASLEHGRI
jgi:hypothetical protein